MKTPLSKPWSVVAMLCATATAGYICRVNVSTAAPLLMEEFGLSQIEMGRIFSAFLLGYALFQIPSGMIADRFGARRVLSWIAWLWVILIDLRGCAHNKRCVSCNQSCICYCIYSVC